MKELQDQLLAAEFGFRCAEKGMNLQAMRIALIEELQPADLAKTSSKVLVRNLLKKRRKPVLTDTSTPPVRVIDKRIFARFSDKEREAINLFEWFKDDPRPGILRAVRELRTEMGGLKEAKEFCEQVREKLMDILDFEAWGSSIMEAR